LRARAEREGVDVPDSLLASLRVLAGEEPST